MLPTSINIGGLTIPVPDASPEPRQEAAAIEAAEGLDEIDREPFARFWRQLESRRHPLAWLPLRLTDVETSFELPAYHLAGAVFGHPGGPEHQRDAYRVGLQGEGTRLDVSTRGSRG